MKETLPEEPLLVMEQNLTSQLSASDPADDLNSGSSGQTTETPRTLNTLHLWTPPADLDDWKARARELRQQILCAAGLWPMPPRPPLKVQTTVLDFKGLII